MCCPGQARATVGRFSPSSERPPGGKRTNSCRAATDPYRSVVLSRVGTGAGASCICLAVLHGESRWHHHPTADELFLVVGRLELDLTGGPTAAGRTLEQIAADASELGTMRG